MVGVGKVSADTCRWDHKVQDYHICVSTDRSVMRDNGHVPVERYYCEALSFIADLYTLL